VAAVVANLVVAQVVREPPNYSRIEDGLWLGGWVAAPPRGTQAVLNLDEAPDRYRVESQRWAPIRDGVPVPGLDWLREQVAFIELERAAGRVVFVHCRNGVSRSGMIVAAYLMKREGWNRDQALEFLRSRRPGVRPNPAFMELLLDWEHALKR
jgi:hypothetical protein